MSDEVLVVTGLGTMGLAIARRVGAGRVVVLADNNQQLAESAAEALRSDGHRVVSACADVSSAESVNDLAAKAVELGRVTTLVHTAGVSPVQASVETILAVDLLGTALILDAFTDVIATGGAGLVVSSSSAYLTTIDPQVERQLATTPTADLLGLPACSPDNLPTPQRAYAFAKRANQLRVAYAAQQWGLRSARLNSLSPGIVATAMSKRELDGESGAMMRHSIDNAGLQRIGTPDDIAAAADFLLGPGARFVSGADLLVDGGVTAAMTTGVLPWPDPSPAR